MKRFVVLMALVLVLAGFAGAADNAKKVVNDVKQTGADIKAVGKDVVKKGKETGKAVVEKGKEAVSTAANATTKTVSAVEKGTEKAGKSFPPLSLKIPVLRSETAAPISSAGSNVFIKSPRSRPNPFAEESTSLEKYHFPVIPPLRPVVILLA